MKLEDIQRGRYSRGAVVFNTSNERYGVVLDGNKGDANDPCSLIVEHDTTTFLIVHSPPNRALIPTGKFIDINNIASKLRQEG